MIMYLEKHYTWINEDHNFQHSAKTEKFHQVDKICFDIVRINLFTRT